LNDLIEGINNLAAKKETASTTHNTREAKQAFLSLGLSDFVKQGLMRDVRYRVVNKKGETIPVVLNGIVLKNSQGTIEGMVVVAKDLRKLRQYAKKRLSEITPVLQKVATGDFSQKLEIPSQEDEFTKHLVAINLMIDDFKEMVEELGKAKTGLEEKIQERTAELLKAKTGLEEEIRKRTVEIQKANEELNQQKIDSFRQLYFQEAAKYLDIPDSHIALDKMPMNIIHLGLIWRVFPEAKIILAVRHPFDACLSCFMQDFTLNPAMANFCSLEDAARLYKKVMNLWQLWSRILPIKATPHFP